MSRRAVVCLLIVLAAGCRTAAPPPTLPGATPARPAGAASTAARAEPDSIRWVRDSAEYRAAVLQTYRLATAHVEREAAGRAAGAWAVVLDADETVISNLTYQAERAQAGLGYSTDSWAAWVRRREATPLPGAAAFLTRVRALGGKIAIVTNRLASAARPTRTRASTRYAAAPRQASPRRSRSLPSSVTTSRISRGSVRR